MDFDSVLSWLVGAFPVVRPILIVLGSLCVVGTLYVQATASKADDEWLQKLEGIPVVGWFLLALRKFSVIQPKPPTQ